MRILLLLVLLTAPAYGQSLSGEWVGPLELTNTANKARGPMPTRVTLTQTDDTITGDWRSLPPNTSSGTIKGTLTTLTVTMYADAGTGPDVVLEPERCVGEARFTGRVTASGILRLTAKTADFDLPGIQAQGRGCMDLRDLIWTLQRH